MMMLMFKTREICNFVTKVTGQRVRESVNVTTQDVNKTLKRHLIHERHFCLSHVG